MSIPIPWAINITPTASGTAQFHPAQITIAVADQVHWANGDYTHAHWPGLLFQGQLNKTFFMPNQIAPNSSSTNWTPSGPGTYTYECSLHPNERGTIVVQ
jgi:plastocyanin